MSEGTSNAEAEADADVCPVCWEARDVEWFEDYGWMCVDCRVEYIRRDLTQSALDLARRELIRRRVAGRGAAPVGVCAVWYEQPIGTGCWMRSNYTGKWVRLQRLDRYM